MSKLLTYLTILAITVLPVKLLSANVDNISINLSQPMQVLSKCQHELQGSAESEQESKLVLKESTCCSEQSHDCQNCNNCPQAVSAAFLPAVNSGKPFFAKPHHNFIRDIFLLGRVVQENLLRPPRSSI